eukprot:778043-Pyramimonas_sp.AAC.1
MQTAPRAELLGLIEVLRALRQDEELTILSDHTNHVRAYARGWHHCVKLENADLWYEFWRLADARPAPLTLSH